MIRILAASIAALALMGSAGPGKARPINQQDLVALDRVSDPHVSPDGLKVIYDLATLTPDGKRRSHAIWAVSTSGGAPVKLADGANARWAPDGRSIYYLAGAQVTQLGWCVIDTACIAAPKPRKITDLPLDVDSFRITPDGKTLVVSLAVYPDADDPAVTRDRQAAQAKSGSSGTLYDHLFIRHWDAWDDHTKNHLFAVPLDAQGVATGKVIPLTKGFDGDVPSKPFGGDEDYTIWPTNNDVVFSARVAGKSEPWSTNFDVFSVPVDGSKAPNNLTADNKAWDAAPVASPDGHYAAWRAMKRPGFEADRFGVWIADMKTGAKHEVDPQWDRSAEQIAFSGDGKSLYVLANDVQQVKLFKMDVATGAVAPLTEGGHIGGFDLAHAKGGDVLVFTKDTLAGPPELYALKPGSAPVQLTHAADAKLAGVETQPYESFTFTGWNNDTVHGWVVKPAGYKPGAKFPTVFLIHGGPQGSWEDSWSNRWNPQVWAGWGYAVVMVDFHGSTGYGQAFTDAISGHWGDRPLEDLQKGWAAAQAKYPFIDGSKACAAGASYGGYMTYWIAGVWSQPWKCLIDHDGVFDNRMMGYATEELWFSEWENGHTPVWQNPAGYETFNPVNHVADWTKPMLVIHSDKDYRIPVEQGIGAFTALQRKGVESQFLRFPDENHWVLKPQNSLQWHDTVQAWLKRWIG